MACVVTQLVCVLILSAVQCCGKSTALQNDLQQSGAKQYDSLLHLPQLIQRLLHHHTDNFVLGLPPGLVDPTQTLSTEERDIPRYEMASGENISSFELPLNVSDMMPLKVAAGRSIIKIIEEILKFILSLFDAESDSLCVGGFATNLTTEEVQGSVKFEDLCIGHLSKTRVLRYDLNLLNLCAEVDVLFPILSLSGVYDVHVKVNLEGISEVFGNGPLQLQVSNTNFHGALCLRFPSPRKPELKVENFHLTVENTLINVENLFDDPALSQLISGIATDVGPGFVEEYEPDVMHLIMKKINEKISELLKNESTQNSAMD